MSFKPLRATLLIFYFGFSLPLFAETNMAPPEKYLRSDWKPTTPLILAIKKGTPVKIDSFNEKTVTFSLRILSGLDMGPNIVPSESITGRNIKSYHDIQKAKDWVGRKILLKRNINRLVRRDLRTRVLRFDSLIPATTRYFDRPLVTKMSEITIDHYNYSSHTYEITIDRKVDHDFYNYVGLEQLARAIPKISRTLSIIKKSPRSLIGKTFRILRPIRLLSQNIVHKREKEFFDSTSPRTIAAVKKQSLANSTPQKN